MILSLVGLLIAVSLFLCIYAIVKQHFPALAVAVLLLILAVVIALYGAQARLYGSPRATLIDRPDAQESSECKPDIGQGRRRENVERESHRLIEVKSFARHQPVRVISRPVDPLALPPNLSSRGLPIC